MRFSWQGLLSGSDSEVNNEPHLMIMQQIPTHLSVKDLKEAHGQRRLMFHAREFTAAAHLGTRRI